MDNQGRVLIVILNYKTYEMTINVVEELKSLDYPNFNVMIVDNCSPNESSEVLRRYSKEKGLLFYSNDHNSGYAAGNNIGIRRAIEDGYEYTWILNNDIKLIDKSVLSKLVKILKSDYQIGCVGPKIFDIDGNICSPYCERPTMWSMTIGVIADKKKREKNNNISQYVYRVHGCCMLLRNATMQQVDCMDERTFLFGEEEILAERMLKIQTFSYYCAEAEIVHMESSTIKNENVNVNKIKAKRTIESMDLYLKEYRGFSAFSRWLCKRVREAIILIRG